MRLKETISPQESPMKVDDWGSYWRYLMLYTNVKQCWLPSCLVVTDKNGEVANHDGASVQGMTLVSIPAVLPICISPTSIGLIALSWCCYRSAAAVILLWFSISPSIFLYLSNITSLMIVFLISDFHCTSCGIEMLSKKSDMWLVDRCVSSHSSTLASWERPDYSITLWLYLIPQLAAHTLRCVRHLNFLRVIF